MDDDKVLRLTIGAMRAMKVIAEAEGRLAGADLIRATGWASGTMYPLLKRLVEAGWLATIEEKGDASTLGRPLRTFYRFTPEGRQLHRRLLSEMIPDGFRPLPTRSRSSRR